MSSNDAHERSGSKRGTATALIALSVYTVIAAGALWWFEGAPSVARIPIALPLFLFAPGYAVVAALFPSSGAFSSRLERGILAVVASIAVVPMIVLASTALGPIDLTLILAGIAGVTVVASVIGVLRSLAGGTETRPSEQYRDSSDTGASARHLATDGVTILAIAVTALLLVASAAVAYTGGGGDELLTEFYLVDDPDTADGTTLIDGEGDLDAYDLRVDHQGSDSQRYTVVVVLERGAASDGSWTELDRTSIDVEPDETASIPYRVSRSGLESDATVRFLLYTGDAPDTPDPDTAHRALALSSDASDE